MSAPDIGLMYRAGLLDGAQRAEQDARDHRPTDAIATDLTLDAKEYGETAQKGLQAHRAYRALLLGTARGYRQELQPRGRPAPQFDARLDYPERYSDGPY